MAEETQFNSPQQEENSDMFASLDQSRLATVLIGVLVVSSGFLMYSYFSASQTSTEEVVNETQNNETLDETAGTLGSINQEGDLETLGEVADESIENTEAAISEDTYVVKLGDSLWKIAESQLGSGFVWVDIARANNITAANAGQLKVGQELVLPPLGATEGTVTTQIEDNAISTETTDSRTYIVKEGDTLWEIAREVYGNGHEWVRIYDHPDNNVAMYTAVTTGRTYPLIEVGQELVIPGAVS